VFSGDCAAHADGCMRAKGPVVPATSQWDSGYAPRGRSTCAKFQHSVRHSANDEPVAITGHHHDAIDAVDAVGILTPWCAGQ